MPRGRSGVPVTTIGSSKLNEFRYQFAQRHQFRTIGTGADGAIRNGLLTSVFTVFENLPLPVMQGLLTTARVAGSVAR